MKWFRALLTSLAGLSALAIFSGRKRGGGHKTFIGADETLRSARFKLDAARLFSKEMSDDLMPASGRSPLYAAIESTGVVLSDPWQERFYPHLDAFLIATNTIPDIITSWCGSSNHPAMKSWLNNIGRNERKRRTDFQTRFKRNIKRFSKLPLRTARNLTVHSHGTPPVNVELTGRWGIRYRGGPTEPLPASEAHDVNTSSDPTLLWEATQSPPPLKPTWRDFHLRTKYGDEPLFSEVQRYLEEAEKLLTEAQNIFQQVHGNAPSQHPRTFERIVSSIPIRKIGNYDLISTLTEFIANAMSIA